MDAITMPSITSLLPQLKTSYPQFQFTPADHAHWNPEDMTVYYNTASSPAELLHELSHALLGHKTYRRDIELIGIERDAWKYARQLAYTYNITITEEIIEDALDSYRDWLHQRSLCPECNATGLQSSRQTYRCLACRTVWRVNEAKLCALRRYKITPQ